MRHSNPNDFPQIGGQGIGIRTLQAFLREGKREIARVYDEICKASSTAYLFPVRGKAFYLEIAKMLASYMMANGKAQEARHKRMRTVFGISDVLLYESAKSFEKTEQYSARYGETMVSRISQVQSQLSAATQQSAKNRKERGYSEEIGTSHHGTEVKKPLLKQYAESGNRSKASTSLQEFNRKSNSSVAGCINFGDNTSNLKSLAHNGTCFEDHEDRWSCGDGIGMQKAAKSMNASIDTSLKLNRPARKLFNARQPVIRGRIRTLDEYVQIWLRGEYRGVLIRKLRSVDYRKKDRPPITNAEWTTEKHAAKRLFEAVNIVAHYLPGREPSESAPEELWEIALNEAYRELGEEKGRKTSMILIKSNAKLKGIDFKCKDPCQS